MKNFLIKFKNIILLQAVVIIYTSTSIIGKLAADTEVMSFKFIMFYGLDVFFLGIYAICWQQMIKRFDLSVAYANRAMALLWTGLWAVIIFKDTLTVKQIIGIVVVVIGTVIINLKPEGGKEVQEDA